MSGPNGQRFLRSTSPSAIFAHVSVILIITLIFAVGIGVSQYAHGKFQDAMRKGRRMVSPENLTGAAMADEFLRSQNVLDVKIVPHEGVVSDYFDPLRRCLYLRRDTREGKDLASWAVALHEAAHALQTGEDKEALKWRQTCISLCRYLPTALFILSFGAVFLLKLRFLKLLIMGLVAACGGALVLNVGTLAIEYNANERLRRWLGARLGKYPATLEKLEAILGTVATREVGDLLSSPRYFFLSALPGTTKKRPT